MKYWFYIAFLILISGPLRAEEKNKCVRGQYIVAASVSSLRSKAEKLLEDAAFSSFTAVDEYAKRGVVLLQEEAELANGVNDASDSVLLRKSDNACEKMRKNRRTALQQMQASGNVDPSALRNYECECNAIYTVNQNSENNPNDYYYSQLWGMRSTSDFGINASKAWTLATGTSETVVAVIDTGVDYNHPDLVDNLWVNNAEIAGNGLDDDGNGYVDDYRGWNAINNSGNPMDDQGHGTHCAGTIGGRGNNSIGVAGVNWQIKIIPVKFLGPNGGTTFDAIKAIDYVTALKLRGTNVVLSNNSWGGGGYESFLYAAIQRARSAGILFVAAAGNGGSDGIGDNNDYYPSYPASYNLDNIISVAALGKNGSLTSFSNYGATSVDIAAPGSGIVSTYLTSSYVYGSLSGTSMAAPHVSGALALLYSYNNTLSWDRLRDILYETSYYLPSLSGKVVTAGLADVHSMLLAAYEPGQTPVPTATPTMTPTPAPTKTPTPVPSPMPTMTPTMTPTPGWYGLSGVIRRSSDGATLSGVKMVLRYASNEFTAYSDAQGNYSFSGIQGPITYSVTASLSGYSFAPDSVYLSTNRVKDITGYDNSFLLSGQVIDRDKQPVAGVRIRLNDINNSMALSDSDGNFSFNVPIGLQYSLTAEADQYEFNQSELHGTIFGNTKRIFVAKDG